MDVFKEQIDFGGKPNLIRLCVQYQIPKRYLSASLGNSEIAEEKFFQKKHHFFCK